MEKKLQETEAVFAKNIKIVQHKTCLLPHEIDTRPWKLLFFLVWHKILSKSKNYCHFKQEYVCRKSKWFSLEQEDHKGPMVLMIFTGTDDLHWNQRTIGALCFPHLITIFLLFQISFKFSNTQKYFKCFLYIKPLYL